MTGPEVAGGETPPLGPGTDVHQCNVSYDVVYKSDQFFRKKDKSLGQVMILDCGCPRSLMGQSEFLRLKKKV